MKDFYKLFVTELKVMYDAEHQIIKALPGIIREAKEPKLKEALSHHLEETKNQAERIETIAKELNIDLDKADCPAMTAILKEGHKLTLGHPSHEVTDAAIISGCQRVEHYEIAVYGTLVAFAKVLQLESAEKLLKETLCEEGLADKKLTAIAEGTLFTKGVNQKANRKSA